MKHAKVRCFKELEPKVILLDDKKTAFVIYTGKMSFNYDSVKVDN